MSEFAAISHDVSFVSDAEFHEVSKEQLRHNADARIADLKRELRKKHLEGDLGNRWDDLENEAHVLQQERDALKAEVLQLRKGPGRESSSSDKALDPEERAKSEALLSESIKEAVAAHSKAGQLAEELQARTIELEQLSAEKIQLLHACNTAKGELLPVKQERDRLALDVKAIETTKKRLQKDLVEAEENCEKLSREKSELRRRLAAELEEVRSELALAKQAASDAKEARQKSRLELQDAELRLREAKEATAEEKAGLESKLDLRGSQLTRAKEMTEEAQRKLREAVAERGRAETAAAEALKQAEDLKKNMEELKSQHHKLQTEHEALLRRRIPGAPPEGPIESFKSLSELVKAYSDAQADSLQQRKEKEEYREALASIDREVRARYPAVMELREEAERLRASEQTLQKQNAELVAQLREQQAIVKDSRSQERASKRQVQIMEAHVKDAHQQIALLVQENQKLQKVGSPFSITKGLPMSPAAGPRSTSEMAFRDVEDLVKQNGQLRLQIGRLNETCETMAQKELSELRDKHEAQIAEFKQHLKQKGEQMQLLSEAAQKLKVELDDAKQTLRGRSAVTSPGPSAPAPSLQPPSDTVRVQEQVAIVREELGNQIESLRRQAQESRSAELQAQKDLSVRDAQLEYEKSRSKDGEQSLEAMKQDMKEATSKVDSLTRDLSGLKDKLQNAEAQSREAKAALAQVRRAKEEVEAHLESKVHRVTDLESSSAALQAEVKLLSQDKLELKARLAEESKSQKALKDEASSQKVLAQEQERLLKEHVKLSETRQAELQNAANELKTARDQRSKEAAAAKERSSELECQIARLEGQIEGLKAIVERRGDAAAAAQRRNIVEAAEAQAQAVEPEKPSSGPAREEILQRKLAVQIDLVKSAREDAKLWENLATNYERDLKTAQAELTSVKKDLGAKEKQIKSLTHEVQSAQAEATKLNKRVEELVREVGKLKSEAQAKDAKLNQAALDLETAKGEAEGRDREAEKIGNDFKEAKEKCGKLADEVEKQRKRQSELEDELKHAGEDALADLKDAQDELAQAKQQLEVLRKENRGFRERLVSALETGDANEATERLQAELRKASELSDQRMQELEMEKGQLAREAKALRQETKELQRRLEKEQDQVIQLQAELKRGQQASAKLSHMEGENKRLEAEVKEHVEKAETYTNTLKKLKEGENTMKQKLAALEREKEAWLRERKLLSSQSEEWQRQYKEVVAKFDTVDIKEFKKMKADNDAWKVQKEDMEKRLAKHEEEMKASEDKLKTSESKVELCKKQMNQLTSMRSDLQKQVDQIKEDKEKLAKDKAELDEKLKKKDDEVAKGLKQKQALLDLTKKKNEELEKEKAKQQKTIADLTNQNKQKDQQLSARPASTVTPAEKKKLEDEANLAKQQADKAMGLAMDFSEVAASLQQERERLVQQSSAGGTGKDTAAGGSPKRKLPATGSLGVEPPPAKAGTSTGGAAATGSTADRPAKMAKVGEPPPKTKSPVQAPWADSSAVKAGSAVTAVKSGTVPATAKSSEAPSAAKATGKAPPGS
eukprot:gnl/MRDRNA2_/MRDRNA2_85824_c0_seq2.p1 gnl/MRDRNA2_/MRDRNA2_85824_c0~~gnl/MRDRNA2_/MRDRNA2_85824_c0_seq2.p1  ORF type:complete len:1539 (+),score=593.15 gnl/MRDRNA2_/MRDRNA2_85824_c0_seq2:70-4686(+)